MKRREFVGMAGSSALLLFTGYPALSQFSIEDVVSTPEKRQAYTVRLLKELCTDLGPRPGGSAAYARGAQIIHREMKRSLPQVHLDTYEFEKWNLKSQPEFLVGGQKIEVIPSYGGEGTSQAGIHGLIKKTSNGFTIVDQDTGIEKAVITIGPYGKAITHHQFRSKPASIPNLSIGKQDVPFLEKAVRDQSPSWLKAPVYFTPGARGMNVVGRLPGKRKDEILFLAHADTVYNAPGANDNTASVIVMLMLAHAAFKRGQPEHTITFVATDNEEFGLLGARNYAKQCLKKDQMKNIRHVINFDSLTYGPNLWISSKNDDIKDILRSILQDLDLRMNPIFDNGDGFVMDSEPFRDSNAKALHANSRGYDEKTLPVYHRPDDNAENVPLDCVESSFKVFDEYLKRIDALV